MTEFNAQPGGRYTYVDDIINLQDIALALTALFDDCDNFVLSGCEVTETTIGPGLVYINGKLRRFDGATGITSWPQTIYEKNSYVNVAYANGSGNKVGRIVYGTAPGTPTSTDAVTGVYPSTLTVPSTGAKTFREAFIGKYALLLEASSQTVEGTVNFETVTSSTTQTVSATVQSGNVVSRKYVNGSQLVVETDNGSGVKYTATVEDGVGFRFYVDGELKLTIGEDGVVLNTALNSVEPATLAGFGMKANSIYNNTTATDSGAVYINLVGYEGGSGYYRNTIIGNGKSAELVNINGQDATITGYGAMILNTSAYEGISLVSNMAKTATALRKAIVWKDTNSESMASVGYTSVSDNIFRVGSTVGDVEITGSSAVNIGPAIQENGVLLSAKYVLRSALDNLVSNKANSAEVYSKTDADDTFAAKANGLSQFVTTTNTQAVLREHIGAASQDDMDNTPKLNKYLADVGDTTAHKKAACANIGAAYAEDYQAKLKDSGWLQCTGQSSLYIRQIGNVVCIQGTLTTVKSGMVFSIPSNIDAPTYGIRESITFGDYSNWSCDIAANSRACNVAWCGISTMVSTNFSMTYMV